jgi:branched-chain amino acid transport system substrate-binding protein
MRFCAKEQRQFNSEGGETRMDRNARFRVLSIVLLLVVVLAGCAPKATPTPTKKVLKFGAAIELTGLKATEGKVLKDGIDFWVEYMNAHGGIKVGNDTYEIEMKYYDDESDPQTAAKLTEKLITEDGTKFLIGPFSSAQTIATCAIGEKYGAITVAPLANATNIYEQGYRYVFSVLPPAPAYLRLLIEMAVKELQPKPQTVAIVIMDDPFGNSTAAGMKKYSEEAGLQVVMFEKYPVDAKDLSSLLTKAKGLNPDMLLGATQFEQASLITRQAKELNFCPKLMGFTVGPTFPDFITSLGKDAEYVFGSEWWLPQMGWKDAIFGDSQNYAKLFEERFGYVPDYHAASGTAAGMLYQFALEKAGTTDVDKVRDALAALDVEFFWGPQAFDASGQNTKGGSGPIQIQDGKHVGVYPADLAQGPPRYPMPCWDQR